MASAHAESSTTLSSQGVKRPLSDITQSELSILHPERKRLRRNSSMSTTGSWLERPPLITPPDLPRDRLSRPVGVANHERFEALAAVSPISRSSSLTEESRRASPSPFIVPSSYSKPGLVRSASSSSLKPSNKPKQSEISSLYNIRDTKTFIDFTLPPSTSSTDTDITIPLACSTRSVVYFTRGNRVHYKNMQTNEDIGQLFKLQDKYGDLKRMVCGGVENSDTLAVATTQGTIQLWDVRAKKMTASWSTKGVGAMQFNGSVLTVGGVKGTLRFYDTRMASSAAAKMKSDARKLTRHQSRVTAMAWNEPGKLLATGDESGAINCWDNRQNTPLDVGEPVQRRKKIQHSVGVTVVNFCPWQPKLLGTGDANGTLRLWDIDTSDPKSNALHPGKLELGSRITGLHFSPYCKEMITVHGAAPENLDPSQLSVTMHSTDNSIVAHSFPTLRHIHTLTTSNDVIAGSVMNANFTKAILAVPKENKLKVYDVWGKYRDLRRTASFRDSTIR
ncbi:hypothetical protein D9757_008171 [Collybiopsis confluens]|uniref:WD40 repeat-like protein n=1 Tax=Collybiopsis confluens TaxID=2823264 RepID=A0A8H5HDY7_9AGAR|nr:hypothetical protein D9757_008171 [Collybiopsis confluens]